MQGNKKNKNPFVPKKIPAEVQLEAEKVAEIAKVSKSLVNKIRSGKRNTDTPAGKRVEITEDLWSEGSNLLIREIKKIVKL